MLPKAYYEAWGTENSRPNFSYHPVKTPSSQVMTKL